MNTFIVDTHAFLWFVFDDPRLSEKADSILSDSGILKVFSMASLWEIAIKVNLEKLKLGTSFENFLQRAIQGRKIEVLGIQLQHLIRYTRLPLHHRDPFDRLIIAQAQSERLALLSADKRFLQCDIETIW